MIPKVIHYCWFGRNPLPQLAVRCIESWKKYLPEYEIKEWNEDNFDVNMIPYTREAYRAKKYAFVSDYARFWILYNYGGLYFDTDVEILKSLDDIISNGGFMGCELAPDNRGKLVPFIAPGLGIGAEPNNIIYKEILDAYHKKHLFNFKGVITDTVVTIVTKILINKCKKLDLNNICRFDDIIIYPSEYFCPMTAYSGEINITENTYSIHHYMASWVNKKETSRYKRALKRLTYIYIRFLSSIFY